MVRKRNWGTSNTFSEAHRRCLPGNFCLWDVDGFLLDGTGEPCAIYEGKFKMASVDRGNFIESFYHSNNLQASFLRKMSQVIPVWICEESTKTTFLSALYPTSTKPCKPTTPVCGIGIFISYVGVHIGCWVRTISFPY